MMYLGSIGAMAFQSHAGSIEAIPTHKDTHHLLQGFNPTLVRLRRTPKFLQEATMKSFNPTLVRLRPGWGACNSPTEGRFNPTLVRLRP